MAARTDALKAGAVSRVVRRRVATDFWCGTGCVGAGDDNVALVEVAVSEIFTWTALGLSIQLCSDFDCACVLEVRRWGNVVWEDGDGSKQALKGGLL